MKRVLKAKYEILEKIEETEKVAVCSARFINSNNPLVIKLYKRGVSGVPSRLRDLTEDMETHFKLNHNCLAKLYDMDFAGDIYFVAMEYVKGCTLFEMVENGMFVTVPQAVNIVTQLGSLISYIHAGKVKNRQIKLSNILVTRLGQVKVLSLSRPLSDMVEGLRKIRKTSSVGSDIFFLGYVLYILISGKYPLDSQNQRIRNFSTVDFDTSEIRWRLDEIRGNEGARKALERILIKTTTRNISKRFKTIDNCLEAFEKHLFIHEYSLNPENIPDDGSDPVGSGCDSIEDAAEPGGKAEIEAVREILFEGANKPDQPGNSEIDGEFRQPDYPANPEEFSGSEGSSADNSAGGFQSQFPQDANFSGSDASAVSLLSGLSRGTDSRISGSMPPGAWSPAARGRGDNHSLIWESDAEMKGESPFSGVDPVWLILFCIGVIVAVVLSWGA